MIKKHIPNKKIIKVEAIDKGSYKRPMSKPMSFKSNPNIRPHIPTPKRYPIIPVTTIGHTNTNNLKIAIVLNLFYKNTPASYFHKLAHLKKSLDFDLYVNFVKGTQADTKQNHKLFDRLNSNNFTYENFGKDIYPKLNILKHIYDSKKSYDYVFLMHDKKSQQYDRKHSKWMNHWADDLITILFNDNLRNFSLHLFKVDNSVGLIGSSKHLHYGPGWYNGMNPGRYDNESNLIQHHLNIKNHLGIQSSHAKPNWFIGGTMFWIRWDCISNLFNNCNLDIVNSMLRNDPGDVRDPSYTHAFERFFGFIPELNGKRVIGI